MVFGKKGACHMIDDFNFLLCHISTFDIHTHMHAQTFLSRAAGAGIDRRMTMVSPIMSHSIPSFSTSSVSQTSS